MELSSERNDLDHAAGVSGGIRPARAGLRIRPATAQPTGLFAAVEMTVLVIVVALAMAPAIVPGNETADRAPAAPPPRHADLPAAHQGQATPAAGDALRGAEQRRPAAGLAAR